MKKILFIIMISIIIGGCSISGRKKIVIDNEFLTTFFYQTGNIIEYKHIDKKYTYIWTGQNRWLVPKIYYKSSNMKISIKNHLWVKGKLLIEHGNYINYIKGSDNDFLKDTSIFGFFGGKSFICQKSSKSCKITENQDFINSLVFNPLFDKNIYNILEEKITDNFSCYTYENMFKSKSSTCIDNDGFIIYNEDSAKKILINSYNIIKYYGINLSGN